MAASKIQTFGNGTPYIPAGGWASLFAWLIDFVVFVLGFAFAFVAFVIVDQSRPETQQISDGGAVIIALVLLFAVPLVYGLWFRNGRALGGACTGTRLVRNRDGGRIGAKGPWAMLVRTILLPLLVAAVVTGGGLGPGGEPARTSIDVARTRRLQEEGYPLTPRDPSQV
ncbi:RDD family protein [Glycomyces tritici]|uniref:RDD family protein n=1 Tax=Glycomyces tritici TaxID=2665176 RepID=A0ABT7YLT6_9ACTN|nr:RDD family protein [Glycomyces tritici]MDN3239606.1 RDD family protein [Glycomyces tritici]